MDTVKEKPTSQVDLEQQAVSLRSEMAALAITDQPSYDVAVEKRTAAVNWLKNAEAFFDPSIADAHALHKKLIAQKKTVCDPVSSTIQIINKALVRYDDEQERIRRAEQARLEAEERAKAEAERIALAEQMKVNGADDDVIDEILDAPVQITTPVLAAPTYQRSSSVVLRDNWGAEITDFWALVKAVAKDKGKLNLLVGISEKGDRFLPGPPLNKLATALKSNMNIPGVKAVNNRGAATGRG